MEELPGSDSFSDVSFEDAVSRAAAADARDIFLHALEATRVDAAIERRLLFADGTLAVDGHLYPVCRYDHVLLVSIGKAAGGMAAAFLRLLGDASSRVTGVVAGACKQELPGGIKVFQGGHPSPNQASLDAATEILRVLETATERDLVVFLVSGGGSSMLEQMLEPGISLVEVAATHKALVESGAPIAEMNAVRKHLSAVKGGRLAASAAPAEQLTVFVSDVPSGELDALASGPTLPDRSTVADVRRIAEKYGLESRFPPTVAQMLSVDKLIETPKPEATVFARSQWTVLLDSTSLEEAAAIRAEELGWTVVIDHTCDDWSAEDAAEYLVRRLEELRATRPRLCLVSAGEVTVRLPPHAGRGGRNQHFALLCGEKIAGRERVVLSAGSDGIDGNSPAAGALVDGTTVARAAAAGSSVESALEQFNSYELLLLLGDAVITGPTGNNLRDLRILLAP